MVVRHHRCDGLLVRSRGDLLVCVGVRRAEGDDVIVSDVDVLQDARHHLHRGHEVVGGNALLEGHRAQALLLEAALDYRLESICAIAAHDALGEARHVRVRLQAVEGVEPLPTLEDGLHTRRTPRAQHASTRCLGGSIGERATGRALCLVSW